MPITNDTRRRTIYTGFQMVLAVAYVLATVALIATFTPQARASEDSHQAAAASTDHDEEKQEKKSKRSKKAKKDSHGQGHGWGYAGDNGPEHWGGLSDDFAACDAGRMQSPIDVERNGSFAADTVEIDFDYRLTALTILHNGHTVQANYAPGSGITVAGKRYELLQFHFHTPSEHATDGKQFPMEFHFVHKSADGKLAVVGVLVQSGIENLAMREMWDHMPMHEAEAETYDSVVINGRDLLPGDRAYYRYMGSLTTPPCSEGVNWFLLTEPVTASSEQIAKMSEALGGNARPLQARNNRLVLWPTSIN